MKKERYFILFFLIGLAAVFFVPVWLETSNFLPFDTLIITATTLYFVCGIGSFAIASVPLYVGLKIKEKGRLTSPINLATKLTSLVLFVLFAAYAVITFILPMLIDYPASCCPTCPSNFICWAGVPLHQLIFNSLLIGFVLLSALSLPFFVLLVGHWIKKTFFLKIIRPQSEVKL